MSLVNIVVIILIAGVIVWLIQQAPFIAPQYKTFASYAILIVIVLWIISALFGWGSVTDIKVGK